MRLSLWQRLRMRLDGHVYVGDRPGWKGPLPFYAFRCEKHGVVQDYPHGHEQRLECPMCRRERRRKT